MKCVAYLGVFCNRSLIIQYCVLPPCNRVSDSYQQLKALDILKDRETQRTQ